MYGDDDDLKGSLLGKTISGLEVNQDTTAFRFIIKDGDPVVWRVDGDCCSSSWWNDGYQLSALWDAEVTDVEHLDLSDQNTDGDYEYIQVYGVDITTSRGKSQLVFRNSSNGYYGGWAHVDKEHDGTGWRGQEVDQWTPIISSDWSA